MARYINADTLIDELKDTFDDGDGIAIGEYWSSKIVRNVIDNLAEYIDVRENVKGEWVLNERGLYACPFCGTDVYNLAHDMFCRHCGADMRGER